MTATICPCRAVYDSPFGDGDRELYEAWLDHHLAHFTDPAYRTEDK